MCVAARFPFLALLRHRDAGHPPNAGWSTVAPRTGRPLSIWLTPDAGLTRSSVACRRLRRLRGHTEALSRLPAGAACWPSPTRAPCRRSGWASNVYATQFHPELHLAGMCTRIDVYRHAGYFEPDKADTLKALSRARGGPSTR